MTSPVLQIVDATDLTTVKLDLNDITGANNAQNGGSVITRLGGQPDWGVPAWEFTRVQSDNRPGGLTSLVRAPLTDAKIPVMPQATSYDNLATFLGYLARLLAEGCTMKWVPAGSALTKFIDIEPSNTPILINGQTLANYTVMRLFNVPEFVTLNITRQPQFYQAELNPAVNLVVNPSMLYDTNANNTPDGWTLGGSPTGAYDPTHNAWQGTIAANGDVLFQNIATTNGAVYTGSVEVYTVSGTRTVQVSLRAHGGSALAGAVATVTATQFGTRVSVTGTTTSTATDLVIATSAGSGTTVVAARRAQFELAGAATSYRMGTRAVSNDPADTTAGRIMVVHNAGEAPAPAILRVTAESSAKLATATVALRSGGSITSGFPLEYLVNGGLYRQCDTASLTTNTASVSDANASDGNAAKTTFGTNGSYNKRVRLKWVTNTDALRGQWHVIVRVNTDAASFMRLQARWALGDITPASWSNDEVLFDTTDVSTFGYVDVDLGSIDVPAYQAFGGLAVELWAQRDSGNGNLWWDTGFLMPSDEAVGTISVPDKTYNTFTNAIALTTSTDIAAISGDPTFASGTYSPAQGTFILNAVDEGCAVGDSAGSPASGGRHTYTSHIQFGADFVGNVVFRAVDVTAGTVAAQREGGTFFFGTRKGSIVPATLQVDTTNGHSYQPQVIITSLVSGGISVSNIRDQFTPVISSGEAMESDADRYTAFKLDSSGNAVFPLAARGQLPVMIPPGTSVLYTAFGDLPNDGYEQPQSILTRKPTVSLTYAPRSYN